jgi:hypothetical protein
MPRGQPVQIAFTADTTHVPLTAEVSTSAEDAIQMAIAQHPTIRGFRVRVNNVETDCFGDNTLSATQSSATPRTPLCSATSARPEW